MKLTPLDIRKQEFKRAVRGFDIDEVETFLDMVAEQFELLMREKNGLNEEVVKLRTQLRDYQQVEKTLQETLMNAQHNINESRESSKREADLIIREAELKAEEILEDTKSRLLQMKNEVVLLKAQKDSFVKRFKQLIQSQIELIDVLGQEDLGLDKYREPVEEEPASEMASEDVESEELSAEPRIIGLDEEEERAVSAEEDATEERPQTDSQTDDTERPTRGDKLSDQFIV